MATSAEILSAVRAAMQPAEELTGPTGADYIAMMTEIAADASGRAQRYAADHRKARPITCYLCGADFRRGGAGEVPYSAEYLAELADAEVCTACVPSLIVWTDAMKAKVIDRMKREIIHDVLIGIQPANVATFGDLHSHVDANGYGGFFDEGWDEGALCIAVAPIDEMQTAVSAWIEAGGIALELAARLRAIPGAPDEDAEAVLVRNIRQALGRAFNMPEDSAFFEGEREPEQTTDRMLLDIYRAEQKRGLCFDDIIGVIVHG